VGQVATFACAVILFVLAGMAVLAWTDPDRKRRHRPGVTLDTEYNIRPVAQMPRQPATPSHATQVIRSRGLPAGYDPPTTMLRPAPRGYVASDGRPEPLTPPRAPSGVSRPYVAPVPSQASRVHDRFHCPGCMCGHRT
jgi:hypothetical protein